MNISYISIIVVLMLSMAIQTAYSESSDCDKNISTEKNSILNSVNNQKAVSLATNNSDFLGLVGSSQYKLSGITVGSDSVDYNDCKLVSPNIQIQFNVLTPNTNLVNCPYVVVLEDPSASKILAVDLGSCSSYITAPQDNSNTYSSSTIIIFGGISALAVVGVSVFTLMKKKVVNSKVE